MTDLCGTAKPRRPEGPCDRANRPVQIVRDVGGVVLVRRSRVYYLGEYDEDEGTVYDLVRTTRREGEATLDQVEMSDPFVRCDDGDHD